MNDWSFVNTMSQLALKERLMDLFNDTSEMERKNKVKRITNESLD